MDDFDQIINQAKGIVDINQGMASAAFPDGAMLGCTRCRYTRHASTGDCARFLSVGWPTHCGATMRADAPANKEA